MKERTKFLLEWERRWDAGEGCVNVSELCRQFGISRDTGHRYIARYQKAGHDLEVAEEAASSSMSCRTSWFRHRARLARSSSGAA